MSSDHNTNLADRVERGFAAPGFREYQQKAVQEVVKGIEDPETDVVLLSAPTGSGKSLILDGAANTVDGSTFITTPLNSLIDQLDADEFIQDRVITLKGRNNYNCIHPDDEGTPVNEAICQRQSDFDCEYRSDCPYYGRKESALGHPEVVTNLSYIMAESMIPEEVQGTFGARNVLMVDECQSIEDFAMNFISFTVSERTVPDEVWQNISIPDEEVEEDMDALVEWLRQEVLGACANLLEYLDGLFEMDKEQTYQKEKLQQFSTRVENFIDDYQDNEWVADIQTNIRKNKKNEDKVVFEPVTIGRFLQKLLWWRGDTVVLSSATIPGGNWLNEIGLGDTDVKKINVPSTFPVENRPIIVDHAVGKMTYNEREKNAWPMAQKIRQIAEHHGDEKGFIHCRSYGIAKLLKDSFYNHQEGQWFRENCMVQDKYNREESLQEWLDSDKSVFFSVAMDEGVDLAYDKCRWQVLAKVLYKSMANKRVKYRVSEMGDWNWYNRHAAIQITQAYGRGVRAPDDECVFYILDQSAKGLIQRDAELFPKWFLEAVNDLRVDPGRGM